MMPLLTAYANLVGIAGGAMVTCVGFDIGFFPYMQPDVRSDLDFMASFALGTIKSVVFGVIVAAAGCLRGMQSGSSASAVGNAATSAVVVIAITAIIRH